MVLLNDGVSEMRRDYDEIFVLTWDFDQTVTEFVGFIDEVRYGFRSVKMEVYFVKVRVF